MAARRISWILVLSLAGLGCRGTPRPVTPKDAPAPKAAPAAEAPQAPEPSPSTPAAPPEERPGRNGTAVVVDPGVDGDGTPATLVEAARTEKERRAKSGKSTVIVNDKNLSKYANKGQITIADPKEKKKGATKMAPAAPSAPAEIRDETYWRNRARDIRERWHQTADDVKKLEQRSTELRQKFYLENDLFVRDNQIKPDWDRVLDRLRQTRLDEEAVKQELDAFLEEGRSSGAMPIWLSEGEEEEPRQESSKAAPKKKDSVPPARSIEPPTFNRGDDDSDRRPPGGLEG
jgi:hypothetical protein